MFYKLWLTFVVILISTNSEYDLMNLSNAMEVIYKTRDKDLYFAFRINCDSQLSRHEIIYLLCSLTK